MEKGSFKGKNTLCHVLSASCGCGTAIDSQPPRKSGWLIYLLQIVVAREDIPHYQLILFPQPSPALPLETLSRAAGSARVWAAPSSPAPPLGHGGARAPSAGPGEEEARGRLQPLQEEGTEGTRSPSKHSKGQWNSFYISWRIHREGASVNKSGSC